MCAFHPISDNKIDIAAKRHKIHKNNNSHTGILNSYGRQKYKIGHLTRPSKLFSNFMSHPGGTTPLSRKVIYLYHIFTIATEFGYDYEQATCQTGISDNKICFIMISNGYVTPTEKYLMCV